MPTKSPCGICSKSVNKNSRAIHCDLCDNQIHLKCNELSASDYMLIKNRTDDWFCINCTSRIFPFINNHDVSSNSNTTSQTPVHSSHLFDKLNQILENDQETEKDDDNNTILAKCKYVDIEEFKNLTVDFQKTFSLFHLNVASLPLNFDDLHTILAALNFEFDVIGITETRLKKNHPLCSNISLENYITEDNLTESSAGGTRLYISNKLSYKNRNDLQMYKAKQLESSFIEIINTDSPNIIVGCIYKHPSMSIEEFTEDFIETLFQAISKERNKKVYLMGDFNIDLLKTNDHRNTSNFINLIESNGYMPKILLPTRITSRSKTLIDNIFTNSFNTATVSGNLTCTVSDHLPQFLIIPSNIGALPKQHNIFVRNMRKFSENDFITDLNKLDWVHLLDTGMGNLDRSFDTFLTTINTLLDKHAPLKKANKKDLKLQQKPWITKGILNSIRNRDIIFRKLKKTTNPIAKLNLQERYKTYRNQIVALSRISKKNHMSLYFANNTNNLKKTWEGIRKIVNLSETSNSTPSCINNQGKMITNPTEISNNFNKFFSSIGNNIQNNIYSHHKDFSDYLKHPAENTLFLTPTDPDEISTIISSFKLNKSTGPNSIPNFILSRLHHKLSIPLAMLANMSFESGSCPLKLKIAKVIPIHKKGSELLVDNYRPISLLSNINKVFEKLVYKRLYNFLSNQNSFFELQFGFRAKHSTSHALISLTEKIREALDNKKHVCGIFVDLKKAFDTVDHEILLRKLAHYGIRGISNEWFRSYLTDRKQFVSINGYDSNTIGTDIGVPQGSVLGPLLFLIYINDLHVAIKNSLVHHFADDTNLLHINESHKRLNKLLNADLKSLCNWLKANKISLNVAKTELIIFKHPNRCIDYNLKLKIDGRKLTPTDNVKYLGIYIDNHLSFSKHINEVAAKLRKANGMLSKIRHYVPTNTLRSIYFAIFDSHIKYACPVWGQKGNPLCDKLISLQNSAMRIITFSEFRSSAKPHYLNLHILNFRNQVELQNCLLVHSQLNNTIPVPLKNTFTVKKQVHDHGTRNQLCLVQQNVRTTRFGLNSIKSQCIYSWNRFVNLRIIKASEWPLSKHSLQKVLKLYFFETN